MRKLDRPRLVLALILLVAAICLSVQIVGHQYDPVIADAASYNRLAINLLENHHYSGTFRMLNGPHFIYDSMYRPPAYPFFLAGVYGVFGVDNRLAVYIIQAILLLLSIVLAHRIALALTGDWLVANLTAAISVGFIGWQGRMVTVLGGEILALFTICAAVLCLILALLSAPPPSVLSAPPPSSPECASGRVTKDGLVALRRPSFVTRPEAHSGLDGGNGGGVRPWMLIAAGLLYGLSTLNKPILLPVIPLTALVVWRWKDLRWAAVFAIVSMAVILPWTAHNYAISRRIVPVATGLGFNFWIGNWPRYYTAGWGGRTMNEGLHLATQGKPTWDADPIFMREGISYIEQNPLRASRIFFLKFGRTWLGDLGMSPRESPDIALRIGDFGIPWMAFFMVPAFVLGIIGMKRAKSPGALPILILLAVWTAGYVAVTAEHRYTFAVAELLFIFTAVPLAGLLGKGVGCWVLGCRV